MINNDDKFDMKSLYEILQDNFILVFLGRILYKFKNIESKLAVEEFITLFSPVVIYETYTFLKKNDLIKENQFFKSDELKKKIANYRMNCIKKKTINSDYIKEIIETMGISFNEDIYDINVIEKDNVIKRFNFAGYIRRKDNDFLENCFATNEEIAKVSFKEVFDISNADFEKILNQMVELKIEEIENIDENLSGKRFSYKSSKLFSKSQITDADKIFILYRYNMISTLSEITKFLKICNIKININDTNIININNYISKINALEIEILGMDIRNLKSVFVSELQKKLDNEILKIDNKFYQKNRQLRNNVHYSKIEEIDDLNIINELQNKYLILTMENFYKQLYYDLDEEDIGMNKFFQYCIENNISQDEIDLHYEDYYAQYYYTNKIIRKE